MFTQKVLIVSCSNSEVSINRDLANKISDAGQFPLYDLQKIDLPILSKQIVEKQIPQQILDLFHLLRKFNTLVLITPEHNGYFPSFVKNILDFLSMVDKLYFKDQNIYLVVASPGASGGKSLREIGKTIFSFTGAKLIKDIPFGKYNFESNFSNEINNLVLEIKKN